jgi:hypothetical protein
MVKLLISASQVSRITDVSHHTQFAFIFERWFLPNIKLEVDGFFLSWHFNTVPRLPSGLHLRGVSNESLAVLRGFHQFGNFTLVFILYKICSSWICGFMCFIKDGNLGTTAFLPPVFLNSQVLCVHRQP